MTVLGLRVARAVLEVGLGVASLSLSAYGFGGNCEPEMAWRSLEGAALTVSLSEFLPLAGDTRDSEAAGGCWEGLPLRVLVLVYGVADSRAAEVGAARVERRVGGMVRMARVCFGTVGRVGAEAGRGRVGWWIGGLDWGLGSSFRKSSRAEGCHCPFLPRMPDRRRFSPFVVSLYQHLKSCIRYASTQPLTSHQGKCPDM